MSIVTLSDLLARIQLILLTGRLSTGCAILHRKTSMTPIISVWKQHFPQYSAGVTYSVVPFVGARDDASFKIFYNHKIRPIRRSNSGTSENRMLLMRRIGFQLADRIYRRRNRG